MCTDVCWLSRGIAGPVPPSLEWLSSHLQSWAGIGSGEGRAEGRQKGVGEGIAMEGEWSQEPAHWIVTPGPVSPTRAAL